MNLSIVGTGYVGLVSGACFAEKGHRVVCVDLDRSKVDAINAGRSPFHEPGLDDLLRRHVGRTLQATTDLGGAVRDSSITLIAVGTPFDGRVIDLAAVKGASAQIGEAMKAKGEYHSVVVKSTVVPGTTADVVLPILEKSSGRKAGRDFGVGMNPEFLTEGEAVGDFMYPDRIVIGGIDVPSIAIQDELYADYPGVPVLRTNPKTAEMIKYVSNCLLANLISFSNEMADVCESLGGVDVADVMRGVHTSRYLTNTLEDGRRLAAPVTSFLWAGCGFGGSCLPKDAAALAAHGRAAGSPMRMLEAILHINEERAGRTLALLERHFPSLKGVPVAVLGLSFRPDTDDMRHSPAIPIIRELVARGAAVRAYDPKAMHEARRALAGTPVDYSPSMREAVAGAKAVLLVTRWPEFRGLAPVLREVSGDAVVVDGRRFLEPGEFARYEGVGLRREHA